MNTIVFENSTFAKSLEAARPRLLALFEKEAEFVAAGERFRDRLVRKYADRNIRFMWTAMVYSMKVHSLIPVCKRGPKQGELQHYVNQIYRSLDRSDQIGVRQVKVTIANVKAKIGAILCECKYADDAHYDHDYMVKFVNELKEAAMAA